MKKYVVGYLIKPKSEQIALYRMPEGHPSGLKVNSFGGKVEEGESLREALVRECKEETGLPLSYVDAIFFHSKKEVDGFGIIHMASINVPETFALPLNDSDSELQEGKWYSLNEVPWDDMGIGDKPRINNMVKTAKFL